MGTQLSQNIDHILLLKIADVMTNLHITAQRYLHSLYYSASLESANFSLSV